MTFSQKLFAHKDNAEAQLNAGINASVLSIPLKAGKGALFPTTYSGSATSLGSGTQLNSTGIQALGVVAGMIIENVTDGSYAVVKSVSTDSIITTRLKGGSDNTWQNSDKWAVNRFVITLRNYDTDGVTVLKMEKVLIDSRSGDNLTVNASGRGYDGTSAQSFSADDYVYLFLENATMEGIREAFAQAITDIDQLVSITGQEIYAADGGGSDAYAITITPAPTAYAAGQVFNFKANTANTGAASLNVNGLGAITIKKNHDQDLDDNDIESGQVVTVVYDGTVMQMQSQIANLFASKTNIQKGELIYAADAGSNDTYAITLSPAPAAYTTGMVVNFKANTVNTGPATLNVNGLGAKTIKKSYNQDLADSDIKANQIVSVIYDGTNFQLLSQVSGGEIAEQRIPYYAGNETVPSSMLRTTSKADGSVLYFVHNANSGNNTVVIIRLEKDTLTGRYYKTHSTTFNPGASLTSFGCCVVGNYLFVATINGATKSLRRYDAADLANVTTITISGTSFTLPDTMWSDGTDLFIGESTSGGNFTYNKYTISGTTATFSSAVTFNTIDRPDNGGAICDGTYVWLLPQQPEPYVIKKYAITGGAAVATGSNRYFTGNAYPNNNSGQPKLLIMKPGVIGVVVPTTIESNSAVTGAEAMLQPITAI